MEARDMPYTEGIIPYDSKPTSFLSRMTIGQFQNLGRKDRIKFRIFI